MQDIFRMVKLQLLKLDLNDLGKIFVYYHVHSSFPFIPVKNGRSENDTPKKGPVDQGSVVEPSADTF